jgi:hypothetical protein
MIVQESPLGSVPKGVTLDRDAVRSVLGRSRKHPLQGGGRWLTVCLAALIALSTILYGGHAGATVIAGAQYATEHSHDSAESEHDHQKPCKDTGGKHHQGTCCISAPGCTFCVPIETQAFLAISGSEAIAAAPPFICTPSDVQIRLRPPKLIVTA